MASAGKYMKRRANWEFVPHIMTKLSRALKSKNQRSSWRIVFQVQLTHLLVLGQGLLGLRELVALRLLGHNIVVVGSHGG